MFSKSAKFYDKIYSFKNYKEEAEKISSLIRMELPHARTILDVACGTAEHARFLKEDFELTGIDLDSNFIDIARSKHPSCKFHVANMKDFDLQTKFDVVMCLFSSIGYLTTAGEVTDALKSFKKHLNPNGIIIVEPWLTPEAWKPGTPHMLTVDEPELKICRINVSETIGGNLSKLKFEYLVANQERVEHFNEVHVLALYTVDEMKNFFTEAGLNVRHDSVGIFGRGLYIGEVPKVD